MNLDDFKTPELKLQSSQGDLNITPTFNFFDNTYPSYWEKNLSSTPTALLYLHYFLDKKSDFTVSKIELLTQDELQKISSILFEKISDTTNLKMHHPSAQDEERIEKLKHNTGNNIEKFYELAQILEENQTHSFNTDRLGALYSPETLASITESFGAFKSPEAKRNIYDPTLNFDSPMATTNRHLDESNEKLMSMSMSLRALQTAAVNMIAENEENRREEGRKSKIQLWIAIVALALPSFISFYEIYDSNNNNQKISTKSNNQYQQLETQIKNQNDILLELKNQNTLFKLHLELQAKNHEALIQKNIKNQDTEKVSINTK